MGPTREEFIGVAIKHFGGPPVRTKGPEMWWGRRESKWVNADSMVFQDYETGDKGGYLELFRIAKEPLPRLNGNEPPRKRDVPPLDNGRQQPQRRVVDQYEYVDEDGNQLFRVQRWLPKAFSQQRWNGKGWVGGEGCMEGVRLVLYRLPELLRSGPDEVVWIVAGEKDVDAARQRGLVATTNPGGEGKWKPEYGEFFRGDHVAIVPDNDEAGRRHAATIDKALAGIAASVTVVPLPGVPEKGDISDWFARGHTIDDLIELYRGTSQTKPGSRIVSGAAFVASFAPPDWLIQGIIQSGRLYACTSRTGHGKTAVWLYNGCMIQAGRRVGGLEAEQGNVLYLAGENPEDLKARMIGMMHAFNLRADQLPYVLPATFPLTEEDADRLLRDIAALGVDFVLIVLDTAASFFPTEDENDNVQAGFYARTLRRLTGCAGSPAVVTLAHPVKNAAQDNLLPRGGGAFLNEMDSNLTCWSENLGESTSLHWEGKIRGPDFPALIYRLKNVDTGFVDKRERPVMTVVAEPIDDFEAANSAAQDVAEKIAVLRSVQKNPGWSMREIAGALGWISDKGAPQHQKVQRAVEAMAKERSPLLRKSLGKWSLTPAGVRALEGL